jgi:hypothetical protein
MEMDINQDWVQYSLYTGPIGTSANGANGHFAGAVDDGLTLALLHHLVERKNFSTVSLRPAATH